MAGRGARGEWQLVFECRSATIDGRAGGPVLPRIVKAVDAGQYEAQSVLRAGDVRACGAGEGRARCRQAGPNGVYSGLLPDLCRTSAVRRWPGQTVRMRI